MPAWDDLHQAPSFLIRAVRLVILPLAILAGGVIGWRLFLAPAPAEGMGPTPDTAIEARSPSETLGGRSVPPTDQAALRYSELVQVGGQAPDFSLLDLDGQLHRLTQHLGQAVLINFWATWCVPCRLEMPALQKAFETYGQEGFIVLGINLTNLDDRDQIEPFRRELGLSFPLLLDATGKVSYGQYRVISIPTSVLVDRRGTVREIIVGAIPLEQLNDKIVPLLQVTP
ncbi:MAG TPA: TlpA disulfide reductase family protein [Anaerolineales bacterium]|nr:TlpA disulfide reductase family protein [Anaerolineales bacterium]